MIHRRKFWSNLIKTSDQISCSVVSDSLRPHESQHARPPCPSPTPGVHSDSRPSSQWCHPAISSSVIPFSSFPQSLPASKSFPMSQLFAWGGQSTGVSALASFLPKNSQRSEEHTSLFNVTKRSVLGVLWKDWCWSWNSNTLATSCEELTHWKRLWRWEGLGEGGEGDDRGWDGWMASPTRWTWVWVNSRSWWWTERPGVLLFMGSQRVRHDWVTELNWTEG